MNTKTTAIDTYLARTAAIHIKVARLRQLADNHFGHDPDAIHWGHVGDLGRVDQALDDLLAIFDGQTPTSSSTPMGHTRPLPKIGIPLARASRSCSG